MLELAVTIMQDIERLGEQGRKIVVIGIHDDPAVGTPSLPKFRGCLLTSDVTTKLEGQIHSQSLDGFLQVFALAPPFRCLAHDSGRTMPHNDC